MRKVETRKTLNAKLFVRFLPTMNFDYDSIKVESNRKVLYVKCLQDLAKGDNVKNPHYWCFYTDGILWNACQQEVYEAVTSGMYEEIFNGVSVLIFAFGQTGTGKSTTTAGLYFRYQNRGLILRILSQLFEEAEIRKDIYKVKLGMSYIEFLGKQARDLITNQDVENIKEVAEHPIVDEKTAWRQIFYSEMRKVFATGTPYKGANCGHTVITFHVHSESLLESDPVINHSKVHIVDMSGIDSFEKTGSEWKQRLDVGHANLSKTLMEQLVLCVNGTAWKNRKHVSPYKSSKFLMYLHDTITPKSVLRFIAHVNGKKENLLMTISTLKFGDWLRDIKPKKLEKTFEYNNTLHVKILEKELKRLRDEAELSTMFNDSPDYSLVSQERFQEIRRAAEAFLFGQLTELTLLSLGQTKLTLEVFRDLFQKLDAEKDQLIRDAVMTATENLQAQFALEKTSATALSAVPQMQKASRRKSTQKESEMSFSTSFRSSPSLQTKMSLSVEQVGMTDRRGISIGPGKSGGSFEGPVTKAFKKLKSRRSDSIVVKGIKSAVTKDIGSQPSKNQFVDDTVTIPDEVPPREIALEQFMKLNADLANDLHKNIQNHEAAVVEAKKKYLTTIADLARLRSDIEDWKYELENNRHISHIYGSEDYGEGTNDTLTESEKNFMMIISQKEEQQNAFIESCHVAFIDLRCAVENLNDAKKALEKAFQDFTKVQYKIAFPTDDSLSEYKWDESKGETISEGELRRQTLENLYHDLHQKLLNHVPNSTKYPKRPWVKLF